MFIGLSGRVGALRSLNWGMRDERFELSAVQSGVWREMRRHCLPNTWWVGNPPCESSCAPPCLFRYDLQRFGVLCAMHAAGLKLLGRFPPTAKPGAGASQEQLRQKNSTARVGPATICTQCPYLHTAGGVGSHGCCFWLDGGGGCFCPQILALIGSCPGVAGSIANDG